MRNLLGPEGKKVWFALDAIARRWKKGESVKVRNLVAFHLDDSQELFRPGYDEMIRNGLPIVFAEGDSSEPKDATFRFGRDVFFLGLWPIRPSDLSLPAAEIKRLREDRVKAFAAALLRDQTEASLLLQRLLVELFRPGADITPEGRLHHHRVLLVDLLRARTSEREET